MADQKISQLSAASTLIGPELLPIVQGGVNVSVTVTALIGSGSNTQLLFNNSGVPGSSANLTWITPVLTIGVAGVTGQLAIAGLTSGSTTIQAPSVASGTWTLQAATDTFVGRATTDTLTNKTITAGVFDVVAATTSIGYPTGTGGTVTQATSKATAVTLNKITGQITMNNAALASDAIASFTLTNSKIAATDILIFNHISAGTGGAYTINAQAASGSATINVANRSAGSLSEAIVIGFAVFKAVTS